MSTQPSTFPRTRGRQLALGVLGGLVLLLGLLTVLAPAGAAGSVRALVAFLGNDYVLVAIVGALALLLGLSVLAVRGKSGLDQAAPPPPEPIYPVPRHGESIDAFLAGQDVGNSSGSDSPDEMRARLRTVAITTVMRAANCTQAEARERVETGAWTDEELAADFLTETETPGLGTRLRAALRGTSMHQQAARVTAAEIATLDAEARS